MTNLKYFLTSASCTDNYTLNIHQLMLNLVFTGKAYQDTNSIISGTLYIDFTINNETYPRFSQTINRSIGYNSSFTVPIPLTTISCNDHANTANPNISANIYFTGDTQPSSASSQEEIKHYTMAEIATVSGEVILVSHNNNDPSSLDLYAEIDGLLLTAGCSNSFPGYVDGQITIKIMDGRDQTTQLIDDEFIYLSGGTSNVKYITLPDNLTVSSIYVEMEGTAQVSENYEDYTDLSGYWAGILPYPIKGIRVYTKESNYTQYGILYVKNGTNGYSIAREFNVLK